MSEKYLITGCLICDQEFRSFRRGKAHIDADHRGADYDTYLDMRIEKLSKKQVAAIYD